MSGKVKRRYRVGCISNGSTFWWSLRYGMWHARKRDSSRIQYATAKNVYHLLLSAIPSCDIFIERVPTKS